jgi:hypothetical protein
MTIMLTTHDPAHGQARLLASRLGELAALNRPPQVQTRLPFVVTHLRRQVAERQQARDKLKANEFLAGG